MTFGRTIEISFLFERLFAQQGSQFRSFELIVGFDWFPIIGRLAKVFSKEALQKALVEEPLKMDI